MRMLQNKVPEIALSCRTPIRHPWRRTRILSFGRRGRAHAGGQFAELLRLHRLVLARLRRRILAEEGPRPVARRPDGPRHEATAAVGTHVAQHGVHAVRAERAFEAADAGFRRGRRQVAGAMFADGAQFEHGNLLSPYCYRAPCRTSSAPFSAIMIAAALVLVDTMLGMAEASITRRRSMPRTRSCGSSG